MDGFVETIHLETRVLFSGVKMWREIGEHELFQIRANIGQDLG